MRRRTILLQNDVWLTEKRKDGRLCHLFAAKKLPRFHYHLPQTHIVSSIFLHDTIFQTPEGTLWTHCTYYKNCVSLYALISDGHNKMASCWTAATDEDSDRIYWNRMLNCRIPPLLRYIPVILRLFFSFCAIKDQQYRAAWSSGNALHLYPVNGRYEFLAGHRLF
jgi:hypothetical protein